MFDQIKTDELFLYKTLLECYRIENKTTRLLFNTGLKNLYTNSV